MKLDSVVVRDVIAIGLVEKKRSIIKHATPSEKAQTIMEVIKVMLEETSRNEERTPLLAYLQNRFYIEEELAKSYLSLLFLLLDTKEGDSWKTLQQLDWQILKVSVIVNGDI